MDPNSIQTIPTGVMTIIDGKISCISNVSGHYGLKFCIFIQIIDELIKQNCNIEDLLLWDYNTEDIKLSLTINNNGRIKIRDLCWEEKIRKSA